MLYLFTFMMVRAMRGAVFNADSELPLVSTPRVLGAVSDGTPSTFHLNPNTQPVPDDIEAVLVATGRVATAARDLGRASFVDAITFKALPLSDIANWRGMPEWVRLLYVGFTICSFLVAILSAILFHFVSHNFAALNLLFLASSNIVCLAIVLRCTFAILTAISSVRRLQNRPTPDESECQSCCERVRELAGFKLLVIVVVGLDSIIAITQLYYGCASMVAPRNASTTIATDSI